MVSFRLVIDVLLVEATVFLLAIVLIAIHAGSMWGFQRVMGARIANARRLLVRAVTGTVLNDRDLRSIADLPVRVQIRVFFEVTSSLNGARRQELARVARQVGLLDRARERCSSRAWWRRLEGARLLTLFATGEDVMLPLFTDRTVAVRTQFAEWAAECPSPQVIDTLLESLGHDDRYSRFAVQDALLRMGNDVVEPLAAYMSRNAGAQVEPALKVACGLANPRFLLPAIALCGDELPSVRARAASLLGGIGSEAGTAALLALLQDSDTEVRAEAVKALGGLGHWPAAPYIAPMLRDAAWTVRHEAGSALWAFGAPGLLYLRRYLHDGDPFAAGMARQVLDLMELTDVRLSS